MVDPFLLQTFKGSKCRKRPFLFVQISRNRVFSFSYPRWTSCEPLNGIHPQKMLFNGKRHSVLLVGEGDPVVFRSTFLFRNPFLCFLIGIVSRKATWTLAVRIVLNTEGVLGSFLFAGRLPRQPRAILIECGLKKVCLKRCLAQLSVEKIWKRWARDLLIIRASLRAN